MRTARIRLKSIPFTVNAVPPQIAIRSVTTTTSTSTAIEYEIIAPGGEDPESVPSYRRHGSRKKTLYGLGSPLWKKAPKDLGVYTANFGDLTPGMTYYLRLMARNSTGEVWTGVISFVRTQPLLSDLPGDPGIWLDATDIDADDAPDGLSAGATISGWLDKSSYARHMTNVDGDPMVALSILNNKPVIDYDGNDRMYTSYDFRANNAADWRAGGYTAFGISRYTGGDNERLITSTGNWLFGHHANRIARYHFDGWIDQGTTADTNFHLFEARHQGKEPSCRSILRSMEQW